MFVYSDELCHYGVLGMKWGIRRYQNPDGTLTSKGRVRYAKKELKKEGRVERRHMRAEEKQLRKFYGPNSESANLAYDSAVSAYTKAAARPALFERKKKAAKLEAASKAVSAAGEKLSKAEADYNRMGSIYEKDAASYKAKAEVIAKKYNVSVSDIVSSREVKVGKAYTDEFIKTGPTLADIPLFGTMYYGRVVAEKDANARREMVREESKKRY